MADNNSNSWMDMLGGLGPTSLFAGGAALPLIKHIIGIAGANKYPAAMLASAFLDPKTANPSNEYQQLQQALRLRAQNQGLPGPGASFAGNTLSAGAPAGPSPQSPALAPPQLGPSLASPPFGAAGPARGAVTPPMPAPPPQAPTMPQPQLPPQLAGGRAFGSAPVQGPPSPAAAAFAQHASLPPLSAVGNPFAGFMQRFANNGTNGGFTPPDFQLMGRY